MKKSLLLLLSVTLLFSTVSTCVFAGNTWVDPPLSEEEGGYYDGNRETPQKEIGYRFAIRNGGELVAIYAALAGSDKNYAGTGVSTFDCTVYKWNLNYDDTVAGTPVQKLDNLPFTKENMFSGFYYMINFETPITAGEYLIVLDDFDAEWALRSYLFSPSKYGHFLTYVDGVAKDATLQWQFNFADGNDWWDEVRLKRDLTAEESAEESRKKEAAATSTEEITEAPDDTTAADTGNTDDSTKDTEAPSDDSKAETGNATKDEEKSFPVVPVVIAAVVVVAIIVVLLIVLKKKKK